MYASEPGQDNQLWCRYVCVCVCFGTRNLSSDGNIPMLVKTPLTQCSPSYSAVVVFAIFATPTTYLSGKSANSLLDQGKKLFY